MKTRLLPLTDATFERGRATEPAIDECAQHGENRDPRDPSGSETVEMVAEPRAAQHGGSEHQHDENERRTVFVLDMRVAAGSQAQLVATQRISADGVIHSVLQTVVDLRRHKFTQLETPATPDNSEQCVFGVSLLTSAKHRKSRRATLHFAPANS
ncbi:hypothetical protein [Caballeronia pedi]|uniref:hypothetical protein n=1 Tax=Caballeronia pedi TaxID=1777141 RepID=UPI001177F310|nr:hypothetical protein [Caballeronia pedi]